MPSSVVTWTDFGAVDHVVIGHCIAVRRDEEAGAFAGDGVMPLWSMRPELPTELVTELLEKFVKRRAGLNRDLSLFIVTVVLQQRWFRGCFDPHRNHCRFYLGDNVGKADWTLHLQFQQAFTGVGAKMRTANSGRPVQPAALSRQARQPTPTALDGGP